MAKRKAKIEFYWTTGVVKTGDFLDYHGPVVNWRLKGANGEVMCQSTQGYRDKTDAVRSVDAVASLLFGTLVEGVLTMPKRVGPGKKPV